MEITKEVDKTKEGTCPYCGSVNYVRGTLDPDGDVITATCTCNDCHGEFEDVFHLTEQVYEQPTEEDK